MHGSWPLASCRPISLQLLVLLLQHGSAGHDTPWRGGLSRTLLRSSMCSNPPPCLRTSSGGRTPVYRSGSGPIGVVVAPIICGTVSGLIGMALLAGLPKSSRLGRLSVPSGTGWSAILPHHLLSSLFLSSLLLLSSLLSPWSFGSGTPNWDLQLWPASAYWRSYPGSATMQRSGSVLFP